MDQSKSLNVFSPTACAAPLVDALEIFTNKTGIDVELSVCSHHCAEPTAERADADAAGHDFLVEIAEHGIHDLCISGAEYLLDDGELRGIVQKGRRRLIAYRRSALVVPAGNPGGIQTLEDLARPGVRVGVSVIDCLKGLWEDVTGRAGLTEQVAKNISFYATGCVAIVEAVAQREIDVAFGWTAFEHLGEGRLGIVELPPSRHVCRATSIAMLSYTRQPERAEQLMDFLTTPEARACYDRYRWALPESLQA